MTETIETQDLFKEYLEENKMQYTYQRKSILSTILSINNKFSAEDILIQLEDITKPTVYATLKLMEKANLLTRTTGKDYNKNYYILSHDDY
jgi:Fe2+ or Zn2+ uptake regulation protein